MLNLYKVFLYERGTDSRYGLYPVVAFPIPPALWVTLAVCLVVFFIYTLTSSTSLI